MIWQPFMDHVSTIQLHGAFGEAAAECAAIPQVCLAEVVQV